MEHGVDGDVAGVHAEREPLHHLEAVGRELERHRRVEDVRVRLQHPVLARLDEEAADVERHAEVAARTSMLPSSVFTSFSAIESSPPSLWAIAPR